MTKRSAKPAKPFFLQLPLSGKMFASCINFSSRWLCKTYDSSYGHSFISACCVSVVTCLSNACIDPSSAYKHLTVADQSPRFQLLCSGGPLLITSRLPAYSSRDWAGNCQGTGLRLVWHSCSCSYIAYSFMSDSQLLPVHCCLRAWWRVIANPE